MREYYTEAYYARQLKANVNYQINKNQSYGNSHTILPPQTIFYHSRMFWNVLEYCGLLSNILKSTKLFLNIPKHLKVFLKFPKCCRMLSNTLDLSHTKMGIAYTYSPVCFSLTHFTPHLSFHTLGQPFNFEKIF